MDFNNNFITVRTVVIKPIDEIWECWNSPDDIVNWYTASKDWHTPKAENDLTIGKKFCYRMEAKDGSFGFDFSGTYTNIVKNKKIEFTLDDGRKVKVDFITWDKNTEIVEFFEPEKTNPNDLQQAGWQSIMDNFKRYIENK